LKRKKGKPKKGEKPGRENQVGETKKGKPNEGNQEGKTKWGKPKRGESSTGTKVGMPSSGNQGGEPRNGEYDKEKAGLGSCHRVPIERATSVNV
jgi:hypothetical protein